MFLEHRKNLGLVEARRTAVNAASGEYIAFADSDDELPLAALRILYDAAAASGADIVHGKAAVFGTEGESEARIETFAKKAAHVYSGTLTGDAIMRNGKSFNEVAPHLSVTVDDVVNHTVIIPFKDINSREIGRASCRERV